jgi:hypothetical protein
MNPSELAMLNSTTWASSSVAAVCLASWTGMSVARHKTDARPVNPRGVASRLHRARRSDPGQCLVPALEGADRALRPPGNRLAGLLCCSHVQSSFCPCSPPALTGCDQRAEPRRKRLSPGRHNGHEPVSELVATTTCNSFPTVMPTNCPPSAAARHVRQLIYDTSSALRAMPVRPCMLRPSVRFTKAFTTAVARRALSHCRPDPGPSHGGHRSSKSRLVRVRCLRQSGAPEARRVRQRRR